jgi:hypothetical protein
MNFRIGGKAAVIATVFTLGGAGVIATVAPASAQQEITATYSCDVPIVGTESITVEGTLTATPNPATTGSAVSFDLDVTSTSLSSPLAINSWSGTADIAGSGAESSSFTVSGSGGSIPAGQDISDLNFTGSWTPSVAGTDQFVVGDVTLNADVELIGSTTVTCTPTGTQPVAETLTVNS